MLAYFRRSKVHVFVHFLRKLFRSGIYKDVNFRVNIFKSKKEGKDHESIQSSPTPEPGYKWESDNLTIDITNESQEVSPFPAGEHKASINRRARKQNKN